MLKPSGNNIKIEILDNDYKEVELEEIPLYMEEESDEEIFLFSDVLTTNQKRIAKKFNLSVYNIFELALLYADVRQRKKSIRQQFRFNKMLFYIGKKLEEEYGDNVLIFDGVKKAPNGPIPIHLKEDMKKFQQEGILDVYLTKKGKKIPGSKEDWDTKKWISIECTLTNKGEDLAKKIWSELDLEMREIIIEVKKELYYMKTGKIKRKVHKEYPKYREIYIQDDEESFDYLL